jgi:ABC-type amino acid transport substrate-binding protein
MLRVASTASGRQRVWMAAGAIALLVAAPSAFAQAGKKKTPAPPASPPATTLERVRASGTLKLGYRTDAQPFSFQDQAGKPAGYSVDLCQALSESVKSELNLPALKVEWVPVAVDNQLTVVQQHQVDALCGAVSVTLERRKQVDFSAPIFPGGVGVLVRSDASARLRDILAGHAKDYRPLWRAVALNILREQIFATVAGTTAEQWVKRRSKELEVNSKLSPVPDYKTGIQAVLDRKVNAFFAERSILLDAVRQHPSSGKLTVIDRLFTFEPLALAIGRGDDDFRLVVDRTLSRFYAAPGFADMYTKWFGKPDEAAITFFRWNALPE